MKCNEGARRSINDPKDLDLEQGLEPSRLLKGLTCVTEYTLGMELCDVLTQDDMSKEAIQGKGSEPRSMKKVICELCTRLDVWSWLFIAAVIYHLWAAFQGWGQTVKEYRQTQTAISVYWILQGGPWIQYETPVLGPPWSIPMEFPLYQWVVALFVKGTGVALEQSGRWVSLLSFLFCLWPAHRILRHLKLKRVERQVILILFLVSPLYIFYSRDFLIEVFAVLLGLCYLSLVCDAIQGGRRKTFVWGAVFGVLCALTKVTTFVGTAYVAGALCCVSVLEQKKAEKIKRIPILQGVSWVVFFVIIPLVVAVIWVKYSDIVKAKNPLAEFLLSKNLKHWNFGTLAQYQDLFSFFNGLVFRRTMTDAVGQRAFFLLSVGTLFWNRSHWKSYFLCLFLYLASAYTFINLYKGHHYYPVATAYLVVAAHGFFIVSWLRRTGFARKIGVIFLALGVAGCVWEYSRHVYFRQTSEDPFWAPFARRITELTPEGSVLFIYGHDFNSSLPFLSKRKAVMDRQSRSLDLPEMQTVLKNLSGTRIGGVILCDGNGINGISKIRAQLDELQAASEPTLVLDPTLADRTRYNCFFFVSQRIIN